MYVTKSLAHWLAFLASLAAKAQTSNYRGLSDESTLYTESGSNDTKMQEGQ